MDNPAPAVSTDKSSPRSPWLVALESTTGKVTAITAFVGVLAAFVEKSTGFLKSSSPLAITFGVLVAFVAAILYIREVRRAKLRDVRRPITVFIGADSFTEDDRSRFFGREDEIQSITRKLVQPQLRFFILSGKSGCGKTSLIRAGLASEIKDKHDYHPVYIRLYNRPLKSLHEALQEEAAARLAEVADKVTATTKSAKSASASSALLSHLSATRKAVGRPLLLFIDQFEEFFTNQFPEEERTQFLMFVRACVADKSAAHTKLVLSVRSDFVDDLTIFDDYIDEPFKKENRVRIDMFDRVRARNVIELSLAYAQEHGGGLVWSPQLIDRILRDLETKHKGEGADAFNSIVLPTELQIVCQMVQAKRWSEAKDYPGKETLIRRYIEDAIETSPKPALTGRVLLELVHENGITRAKPQSAREIATRLKEIDAVLAERILKHLVSPCRLANQLRRESANGTESEMVYELAHEYLVNVINTLSGKVIDNTRQANVLLDEYQKRVSYNSRLRIPFSSCWQIRRYATEPIPPQVLQAMGRSERRFLLWASILILLPTILIVGVRYGTVHFALDATPYDLPRVVIKRGLPFLHPLLGSDDVLIDTGFSPGDLSARGTRSCQQRLWIFNLRPGSEGGWARLLTTWRQELLFKQLDDASDITRSADALVGLGVTDERIPDALLKAIFKEVETGYITFSSDQVAKLLTKFNVSDERLFASLSQALNPSKPDGISVRAIQALSKAIAKRNPDNEKAVTLLLDKYDALRASDRDSALGIIDPLGSFKVRNERVVSALLDELNSELAPEAARSLRKLNANEPRVREALLEVLGKPGTCLRCTEEIVDTLIKFKAENNSILKQLYERLDAHPSDPPQNSDVTDPDPYSLISINILKVKPDDERAVAQILNYFRSRDREGEFQLALSELEKAKIQNREINNLLLQLLSSSKYNYNVPYIVTALQAAGIKDEQIAEALPIHDENLWNQYLFSGASKLKVKNKRAVAVAPEFLPLANSSGGRDIAEAYARLVLFDPAEDFTAALNRLWQQLGSNEAEASFGYRSTVQYALALLAQQQVKEGIADTMKIEAIKSKIREWQQAVEPHHRVAAANTLDMIDEFIEQAQPKD